MKRLAIFFLFAASISAQTQIGGGGSSSGGGPNLPVPIAQAQGPRYNVMNYGAKGDAQHIIDGVTAGSGSHTVTSASAPFLVSDVGKKMVCASANNSTPLMPVSTITAFNSSSSVTTSSVDNGASSSLKCIWYTQDDASAFVAAQTAANGNTTSIPPGNGKTLGALPGSVYCPQGGYAVGSRIFNVQGNSTLPPGFIGAGPQQCIIYMIPGIVDPGDGFAVLISSFNSIGEQISGFTVNGLAFQTPGFTHPIVQLNNDRQWHVDDVVITDISTSGTNNGTIDFAGSSVGETTNVVVQGGSGRNDFACSFSAGASTITNKNLFCSNHTQNLLVAATGIRTVAGDNGILFLGGVIDECASLTLDCAAISNSGLALFNGTSFMVGTNSATISPMTIDGTSVAYLTDVSLGHFGVTTAVSNGLNILSGGQAYVTGSTIRGNGSGANGTAVTGAAGSLFADLGGNIFQNCVSGTCTNITPATYATQGFTGGIVPKATVTHSPNTCYAVTGNLLATAQNLCTFLNDQNYQLLNITAQSGGTTPANSSCATPPVITLSDGTRTATLTMTTAKTQWSSAVDAVTNINQVFATGTTLTISIGASTCATPPVNVGVSYVLQSVLNP